MSEEEDIQYFVARTEQQFNEVFNAQMDELMAWIKTDEELREAAREAVLALRLGASLLRPQYQNIADNFSETADALQKALACPDVPDTVGGNPQGPGQPGA